MAKKKKNGVTLYELYDLDGTYDSVLKTFDTFNRALNVYNKKIEEAKKKTDDSKQLWYVEEAAKVCAAAWEESERSIKEYTDKGNKVITGMISSTKDYMEAEKADMKNKLNELKEDTEKKVEKKASTKSIVKAAKTTADSTAKRADMLMDKMISDMLDIQRQYDTITQNVVSLSEYEEIALTRLYGLDLEAAKLGVDKTSDYWKEELDKKLSKKVKKRKRRK